MPLYGDLWEIAEIEVPVTGLDQLLTDVERIRILKIDVQGLELPVLHGATRTLEITDVVLLETNFRSHYQGDTLFPVLDEFMGLVGFDLFRFGPQYHDSEGRLLWADAVYARRDLLSSHK